MSLEPEKRRRGRVSANVPQIELKPGKMTRVLKELGRKDPSFKKIEHVTDIPNNKIPKYVDALVKKYGPTPAYRMVLVQIVFRKNSRDPDVVKDREKFELMKELIQRKYLKG